MNHPKRDLDKLRCVVCREGSVEVDGEAFRCPSCAARIDSIEGVPFIGSYESADLLGLIEIAAVKEVGTEIDEDSVERVEVLCEGYFESGESSDWLAEQSDPFAAQDWFPYRYSEWRDTRLIAEGVDWDGAEVLDVGAGVGYDAIRYLKKGSRVTAIEYNPASIDRGIRSVPEACWVGGFSHFLPFKDEQFDIVCVNAALHHMRDVRQALREMFRVLKPQGTLLTSGDPFRPVNSTEMYELRVFDSHPAVLGGMNEGIPNLQEFLDHIQEFDRFVSGFAVTHALRSFSDKANSIDLGNGYRRWKLQDLPGLGQTSGSIALHLTKTQSTEISASFQAEEKIRPGDYYDAIRDLSETMNLICAVLPEDAVNRPLVPDTQSFFDLLNGWKAPRPAESWRHGFGRGRWFLEKKEGLEGLSFALGWDGKGKAEFEFLLNGRPVDKVEVSAREGFSISRVIMWIAGKAGHSGLCGRVLRRLSRYFPSSKPFHQCEIHFPESAKGKLAFEIRNLSSAFPEFTVGSRVLI